MTNKKSSIGTKIAELSILGVSLAGIAAGSYFFLGPKGKAHQKHAKAWAIKMKGDIVEKFEKAKEVSEPIYHEIINSVAANYIKGMKATQEEVEEVAADLKKHWKVISKSAKGGKKTAKKNTKK